MTSPVETLPTLACRARMAVPMTVLALAVLFAVPGLAQQSAAPPYEKDLLRLSEVLGAVHYLRGLCGHEEGQYWRERMQDLIDAEDPVPVRRARLANRFNRGFETFERTYRACTPPAKLSLDRYMEEGRALSRTIATRYGG